MGKNVYTGVFESWEDVLKQFSGLCKYSNLSEAERNEYEELLKANPEPRKVYHANYDHGGYDGQATVIWQRGKKFYMLSGSHCSCYGLEDTGFEPEEYESKELFVAAFKKARWIPGMTNEEKDALIKKLEG